MKTCINQTIFIFLFALASSATAMETGVSSSSAFATGLRGAGNDVVADAVNANAPSRGRRDLEEEESEDECKDGGNIFVVTATGKKKKCGWVKKEDTDNRCDLEIKVGKKTKLVRDVCVETCGDCKAGDEDVESDDVDEEEDSEDEEEDSEDECKDRSGKFKIKSTGDKQKCKWVKGDAGNRCDLEVKAGKKTKFVRDICVETCEECIAGNITDVVVESEDDEDDSQDVVVESEDDSEDSEDECMDSNKKFKIKSTGEKKKCKWVKGDADNRCDLEIKAGKKTKFVRDICLETCGACPTDAPVVAPTATR